MNQTITTSIRILVKTIKLFQVKIELKQVKYFYKNSKCWFLHTITFNSVTRSLPNILSLALSDKGTLYGIDNLTCKAIRKK